MSSRLRLFLSALLLCSCLPAVVLSVGAPRAGAAVSVNQVFPVPYGGVYILDGHGFGHGMGLSQWGAEYGAANAGASYQSILAHYYPGTTLAPMSPRDIRVLITGATTNQLFVDQASGLSVIDAATGQSAPAQCPLPGRTIVRWGVAAALDTTTSPPTAVQQLYEFYSGGYYHCPHDFAGPITFSSPSGVTEVFPSGTTTYLGKLAALTTSASSIAVVNTVPLENYVAGVVPNESPASWPPAALEAQAVAARSYALFHYTSSAQWDICDSTSCQVYGGESSQQSSTDAATAATKGQVLTYGGGVILAMYSASNGGFSVYGNEPYLPAQPDPWDVGSPEHDWTVRVSAATIAAQYGIGQLRNLTVTSRDGNGEWGGRVLEVTLNGTGGSVTVSGAGLSGALGLMSNWWTVDNSTYAGSFAPGYPVAATWQGSSSFTLVGHSAVGGVVARTWLSGSGWQAPGSLGGSITGSPAIAAGPTGPLDTLVEGPNSQAYIRPVSGGQWGALGGSVGAPLSGVAWAANYFSVFARGSDGALWTRTWHGAWGSWARLGGVLTAGTGTAAISPSPGRIAVFVNGPHDVLYERDYGPSGWSKWFPLGETLSGTPAAAFGNGRGLLAVRQGSNILIATWHPDTPTSWATLGTGMTTDPAVAAVATTSRAEVLAWAGGSLMMRTWTGTSWTPWQQLS